MGALAFFDAAQQPLSKEPAVDRDLTTMLLGNAAELVHHKLIQLHIDLATFQNTCVIQEMQR